MRWSSLFFILPLIGGIAADLPAVEIKSSESINPYGTLYGPSGKPELKDLDVINGMSGLPNHVFGAQLFAILQTDTVGFLKQQLTYISDLDGAPAFTVRLWDKDLKQHSYVMSQPPDTPTPWWWWAYIHHLHTYTARSSNGESIFAKHDDNQDYWIVDIMRTLTGQNPTSYTRRDGTLAKEIDSEEKLLKILEHAKTVPTILRSTLGLTKLGSQRHYAIAGVEKDSKGGAKVKLWRTLQDGGQTLHVTEFSIKEVFEDVQEVVFADNVRKQGETKSDDRESTSGNDKEIASSEDKETTSSEDVESTS